MNWTSVEAVCNCPNSIESYTVFVPSYDVDDLAIAKEDVDEGILNHITENEYCSMETVDRTIYWEGNW